jgi:hypothetical protein
MRPLAFCQEIAEEMVRAFGIAHAEAVARINRQWSKPGPSGRVPRIWILGVDLAYHQMPDDWAGDIYFGEGSRWWHRRHTLSRYHRPDRQHGQDGA